MVEPPVAPGVKAKDTVVLFVTVAVGVPGVAGTVVAVIEFEEDEAALVPAELVAVVVKVYEVALARPVTVNGEDAPDAVKPPGDEVAVYEVGVPPEVAAVNVTVAEPLLKAREVPTLVAVPMTGASGTSMIGLTIAVNPSGVPSILSSLALRTDIS